MKKDKIAVVGRSNVGKSSAIKLLTGVNVKSGRRPGVTLKPSYIKYAEWVLVDMPGFGFMSGVREEKQEEVKDSIVDYLEHSEEILFAIQVTDVKAFPDIAKRWEKKGHVPLEVEMFNFLKEVGLSPILVANKIDKVKKRDPTLDEVCSLLGLHPPWTDHKDTIVPFSAKTGAGLKDLKNLILERGRA